MKKKLILSKGLVLLAAPAMAHPGHGFGFVPGILHPLTGADHLLAMLAVGPWSGFVLPSRVATGAATFMATMVAGAALVWFGVALPGVEAMTIASVVALGLAVAGTRRGQSAMVTAASLAMVTVFAACHGYANAVEASGPVPVYLAGFLLSTAALHVLGIGLARQVARFPLAQSLIGAGIAGAGAGLLMMVG
jgi:urease accessory protein